MGGGQTPQALPLRLLPRPPQLQLRVCVQREGRQLSLLYGVAVFLFSTHGVVGVVLLFRDVSRGFVPDAEGVGVAAEGHELGAAGVGAGNEG